MALAMDLPGDATLSRSYERPTPSSPPSPNRPSAKLPTRRPGGRAHEAGVVPHASPQLCHPPPRRRLRHPNHPRTPRSPRRRDHHALHTRPQSGPARRQKPTRLSRPHCHSRATKRPANRSRYRLMWTGTYPGRTVASRSAGQCFPGFALHERSLSRTIVAAGARQKYKLGGREDEGRFPRSVHIAVRDWRCCDRARRGHAGVRYLLATSATAEHERRARPGDVLGFCTAVIGLVGVGVGLAIRAGLATNRP